VQIPARLQSGRGLGAILIWTWIGHGTLLACACLSDMAAGGDFLQRWLPGGDASLAEPWVGAPPLARLLAILLAGLTGVSLARGRFGWLAPAVVGALVLVPWAGRTLVFGLAGDGLALQPFLAVPFWALGLAVGYGLVVAWQRKYSPREPDPGLATETRAWSIGALLVLLVTLGAGEACARYVASVAWNGYVDRLRAQVAVEDCTADAIARVAYAQTHAPELVAARVEGGCESLTPHRSGADRQRPIALEPTRVRAQARGLSGVLRPWEAMDDEERGRQLAIVYQALYGAGAQKVRCDLSHAATTIRTTRDSGVPTVVLDAGSLTHLSTHRPEDLQQAGLAANRTLDAAGIIGFDAICPGRGDLALGLDWLRMQAELRGLPYVSANLFDVEGHQVFPSYRVVQAGSWRVGIVGVTGANPACEECDVRAPVAAARVALEELARTSPDVTVCIGDLYGTGFVQDTELVQQVEGFDFFLGSSSNTSTQGLAWVGETLVARTRARNGRVELLAIASVLGGRGYYSDRAADEAERRKGRLAQDIGELEERVAGSSGARIDWQHQQLESRRAELASLEATPLNPEGRHVVTLHHLHGSSVQPDPEVAAVLEAP
jgi:hypothetical protein